MGESSLGKNGEKNKEEPEQPGDVNKVVWTQRKKTPVAQQNENGALRQSKKRLYVHPFLASG